MRLQVVLRDDLVTDLGVRDRAAPQRRRALRREPDRAIERAGGLVRAGPRHSSACPSPFQPSACGGNSLRPRARTATATASENCSARNSSSPSRPARQPRPDSCAPDTTIAAMLAAEMSAAVGADVESLCSKCGDVWHVVVAKVGDTDRQGPVQAVRRVPPLQVAARRAEVKKKPAYIVPRRSPRAAGRRPKAPVERFEKPAVAADLTKPVRPYRASERFDVGDRVDHPSFGQGVVEVSEPGKVTVFFAHGPSRARAGRRIGRDRTGLERPKPFDHSKPTPGRQARRRG